jgi:hypothetical protein
MCVEAWKVPAQVRVLIDANPVDPATVLAMRWTRRVISAGGAARKCHEKGSPGIGTARRCS